MSFQNIIMHETKKNAQFCVNSSIWSTLNTDATNCLPFFSFAKQIANTVCSQAMWMKQTFESKNKHLKRTKTNKMIFLKHLDQVFFVFPNLCQHFLNNKDHFKSQKRSKEELSICAVSILLESICYHSKWKSDDVNHQIKRICHRNGKISKSNQWAGSLKNSIHAFDINKIKINTVALMVRYQKEWHIPFGSYKTRLYSKSCIILTRAISPWSHID